MAQEGAAQNKIPGGDVERGLRRAFGFGRRACSSPHTAQPEELCRGLGWERGLCLPQPLAGTLGLASCRDFPAAVEFAAVTAGILLHAAQAQSSQTGIARCCKEGKKSFLHYRSPTTRSHLPASLQHFRILLNILMEKHTRAVGWVFFNFFSALGFFFPFSNCTVARSFKAKPRRSCLSLLNREHVCPLPMAAASVAGHGAACVELPGPAAPARR